MQGVTTIHEDSAVCKVSTSRLTMEVEAATHALRWIASGGDSQTTHAIILTHSTSLLQENTKLNAQPGLACGKVPHPQSQFLVGVLSVGRLAGKTPSQVPCVSEI